MPASRTIPLWAANRGIRLMVRAALAQERLEPVAVEDMSALRRAVAERPVAVLAASEDLRLAGVDVSALVHVVGDGPAVVVFNTSRQPSNPQGTRARFVAVPFTTRELLDALGLGASTTSTDETDHLNGQAPHGQAQAATLQAHTVSPQANEPRIAELVRAEVERQVGELARATVEELARRVVPEMAESLIKQELARLIAETEASAPLDGGPDGDEG